MQANKVLIATFFGFCTGMAACAPALAQDGGLVKVDIKHVADNIAKSINVDATDIPLTVQASAEVAGEVCKVAAGTLRAQGGEGGVGCTAMVSTPALEQIVKRQVKLNTQQ